MHVQGDKDARSDMKKNNIVSDTGGLTRPFKTQTHSMNALTEEPWRCDSVRIDSHLVSWVGQNCAPRLQLDIRGVYKNTISERPTVLHLLPLCLGIPPGRFWDTRAQTKTCDFFLIESGGSKSWYVDTI